jgi:hypothetical protein
MADVPVAEEDFTAMANFIDAVQLDASAPQDLQDLLANAIQARNNYGSAQATPDSSMAAPA